ncbi:MAG: hypothetical protein ACREE6_13620 [Limisphaerales bacterium]
MRGMRGGADAADADAAGGGFDGDEPGGADALPVCGEVAGVAAGAAFDHLVDAVGDAGGGLSDCGLYECGRDELGVLRGHGGYEFYGDDDGTGTVFSGGGDVWGWTGDDGAGRGGLGEGVRREGSTLSGLRGTLDGGPRVGGSATGHGARR